MPKLKDPRYELFAEARASGHSAIESCRLAGFKGQDNTLYTQGWKLLRRTEIQNRIWELAGEHAKKLNISRESITIMLLQDRERALAAGQFSAAASMLKQVTQLFGLDAPVRGEIVHRWETMSEDEIAFEFATLIAEARTAAGVEVPKMIEHESAVTQKPKARRN